MPYSKNNVIHLFIFSLYWEINTSEGAINASLLGFTLENKYFWVWDNGAQIH